MKKLLVLTLFTAFLFNKLTAQTEQGGTIIGISSSFGLLNLENGSSLSGFSFSRIKLKSDVTGFDPGEPDKQTRFNLTPRIGYFVIDNLSVGLDITLSTTVNKSGDIDLKESNNFLLAGPFVRYYIPTDKVFPFVEVSGALGGLTSKTEGSDSFFNEDREDKSSLRTILGGAGMAVPLGDKVLFDFMVGYSSLFVKQREDNPENFRTLINSFGFRFGFAVVL